MHVFCTSSNDASLTMATTGYPNQKPSELPQSAPYDSQMAPYKSNKASFTFCSSRTSPATTSTCTPQRRRLLSVDSASPSKATTTATAIATTAIAASAMTTKPTQTQTLRGFERAFLWNCSPNCANEATSFNPIWPMANTQKHVFTTFHLWSLNASLACHELFLPFVARPRRTCSHCKHQNSPATVPDVRHMMTLPSRRCYQPSTLYLAASPSRKVTHAA
mmetsp:Transcript_52998/g.115643  ORF Transcript_52998/g.115643 Transcript_52998/m.115643 type:complete len:220 (+) Transcript_52998:914-1573(+)